MYKILRLYLETCKNIAEICKNIEILEINFSIFTSTFYV